jgi:hypothetical protein
MNWVLAIGARGDAVGKPVSHYSKPMPSCSRGTQSGAIELHGLFGKIDGA